MGEAITSVGPAVNQTFLNTGTDEVVDDIEVTIRKPGTAWLCIGRLRFQQPVPDAIRRLDVILAVNGAFVEETRAIGRFSPVAGFPMTIEVVHVLGGLSPGDTVQLWVANSIDATTFAVAGECLLQVIAFGPEFRPQGFLEDTG